MNWLAARGSKLLKPADWWKKGKEIVKWGTKIAAIAADLGYLGRLLLSRL